MALKKYFDKTYHSKAALRSPPHITLHMPFQWKENKEQQIFNVLDAVAVRTLSFEVVLKDFGAFHPRVIYIDVVQNDVMERLRKDLHHMMKSTLQVLNATHKSGVFHPHVTLAFRDLKKNQFNQAWSEFAEKPYHTAFTAAKLTLLKHNGKTWDSHAHFKFSGLNR